MTNFCMLYWDMGCKIRKQNTIVSWKELKKLVDYLKKKGLRVNAYIFEIGENFVFDDSIKIHEKLEYYEKSKKSNLIINHPIMDECVFIGMMDSDLFFGEEQYDMIYDHIKELENGDHRSFFTYNLLDLSESQRNGVIDENANNLNQETLKNIKSQLVWRHSWGSGVLGGFYFTPLSKLREIGGFNEKFLTWGAEDDEAHARLKSVCVWKPKIDQGPYHLWHPKNEKDEKYYIPVYSDEYFQINKVEKPR